MYNFLLTHEDFITGYIKCLSPCPPVEITMTNNELQNKKERQCIPFSTVLLGLLLCDLFQSKNWAAEELPTFPDYLLLHGS